MVKSIILPQNGPLIFSVWVRDFSNVASQMLRFVEPTDYRADRVKANKFKFRKHDL